MSSNHATPAADARQWPKWVHALLMLLVGPLAGYLVAGFAFGFPDRPETARAATLDFGYWFGITAIGLIISWAVLIKASRSTTWVVMLIITGGMGYMSSPMRTDLPGGRVAKHTPDRSESIEGNSQDVDSRFVVNEVIEDVPAGMVVKIDADTVRRFEEFYKDDFRKRLTQRFKDQGQPVPAYNATATTLHLQEEGHDIYATELVISDPASTAARQQTRKIWVFWNFQDNKVKRVQCTYAGETFTYRRGKCGEQIAKTFGWEGWHSP